MPDRYLVISECIGINTNEKLQIESIVTLDYYDGDLKALIKVKHSNKWFFCSIQALDYPNNLRLYSVISVPESWGDIIVSCKTKDKVSKWEWQNKKISSLFKEYKGSVCLILSRNLMSTVLQFKETANSNRWLQNKTVEDLFEEEDQDLFELLNGVH